MLARPLATGAIGSRPDVWTFSMRRHILRETPPTIRPLRSTPARTYASWPERGYREMALRRLGREWFVGERA